MHTLSVLKSVLLLITQLPSKTGTPSERLQAGLYCSVCICRQECNAVFVTRISQDLALIAREINDVAGEIDSVTSSGTAPSTTVSTAATTPGSAIDTREEVGDLHGEMHKVLSFLYFFCF